MGKSIKNPGLNGVNAETSAKDTFVTGWGERRREVHMIYSSSTVKEDGTMYKQPLPLRPLTRNWL